MRSFSGLLSLRRRAASEKNNDIRLTRQDIFRHDGRTVYLRLRDAFTQAAGVPAEARTATRGFRLGGLGSWMTETATL